MKTFLVLVFAVVITPAFSQDTSTGSGDIKTLLDNKSYTFTAETVSPLRAPMRPLNSTAYTLTVKGDSVIADLPYFGRLYQADIGSSDGGLKFTSVKSEYVVKQKKKGWSVSIKVRDARGQPQLFLTVYDNGRANLNVTSTDRQAISYSGNVKK